MIQKHAGTKGVSETSYEIARGKSGGRGLPFLKRISEAQGRLRELVEAEKKTVRQ